MSQYAATATDSNDNNNATDNDADNNATCARSATWPPEPPPVATWPAITGETLRHVAPGSTNSTPPAIALPPPPAILAGQARPTANTARHPILKKIRKGT